jgi:hypothetical protein
MLLTDDDCLDEQRMLSLHVAVCMLHDSCMVYKLPKL